MTTNTTSESNVTIGLIQMACSQDTDNNLKLAMDSIRTASQKGAQIICLPELFQTPYFCQTEDAQNFSYAEHLPSPTSEALSKLAKELEVVLIVPVFEKRAQGLYHNTALVIDADGKIA